MHAKDAHMHIIPDHIYQGTFLGENCGKLPHEMGDFKDFTKEGKFNWLDKCCYNISHIPVFKKRMWVSR